MNICPDRDICKWTAQEQAEGDIRIFRRNAIQWQGDGTYYFINALNVWCRVKCVEVLDIETEKGTELVHIKENQVKEF